MRVSHDRGKYEIRFAKFESHQFFERDFLIVDSGLSNLDLSGSPRSMWFSSSEEGKTLGSVSMLADWLFKEGATRESRLVAVGGGVVQDVATLTSSLYMRGIEWIYFPTTTNSMMDSCVGGKSAINTVENKNLIGNFYPPSEVTIDSAFLETLGTVDYLGGILEGLKIIYAVTPERIGDFVDTLFETDFFVSEDAIRQCLDAKIRVVEEDEFDNGVRRLLNYGHTFGHALEAATNFRTPHGIAVGLGMLAANSLSAEPNSQALAMSHFVRSTLDKLPAASIPSIGEVDWEIFERSFLMDKKHSSDFLRIIAPSRTGRLEVLELPRCHASLMWLCEAMKGQLDD